MAGLRCGSALRLMESVHLRVKDRFVARRPITARKGKDGHDRWAILPRAPSKHRRSRPRGVLSFYSSPSSIPDRHRR